MKYGVRDYLKAKQICKNQNNFGNSCWEHCPYRENGVCELSKEEGRKLAIKELFPNIIDKDDSFEQLLSLVEDKPALSKRKALVSGSFDPFTYGHLAVVKQAAEMFDEVHIVAFINAKKTRHYNVDDMVKAIEQTLIEEGITNCVVTHYEDLLAKYCLINNITCNIRGLRNNLDYNYEESLVDVNKFLNKNLKTIYVRSDGNNVSSSMVRELMSYGEDVSTFVPKPIYDLMKKNK